MQQGQNKNNQSEPISLNIFSLNNITSKTTLYQNTPFKNIQSQIKTQLTSNQRKSLILSAAQQIETQKTSRKRYQSNHSLEKFYEKHFNNSHFQHDKKNFNEEKLFNAKLKILAIMKKLHIQFNQTINFAQITIEEAIQQLYYQTKNHIHNLQQRIQQLISEKYKNESNGFMKQKYKQLHIQQQMAKISNQLRDLDQIKFLKKLNMQYLQQIQHLMENIHMKDLQIQQIHEELAQGQAMIKAQQDGVDNLINRQQNLVKTLNLKIDILKKQRGSLKQRLSQIQIQNQKNKRQNTNLQKNISLLSITLENQKSELELANEANQQIKKRFKQKKQDYEKQIKLLNDKYNVENQLCIKKDKTIQSLKQEIDQWMNFEKDRQIKHNEQIKTLKSNILKERQKYNNQIDYLNDQLKKAQQLIYQKQKIIFDLQQIQQQMIKKGQQSIYRQKNLKISLKQLNQKYNLDVEELIKDLQKERKQNNQNSILIIQIDQKNKNLSKNIQELKNIIQERQKQFKNTQLALKQQHKIELQQKQKTASNEATLYRTKIDEMYKTIDEIQQSNRSQQREINFLKSKQIDNKKQYQRVINVLNRQSQKLKSQNSMKQSIINTYESQIKVIKDQIVVLNGEIRQIKQICQRKENEISAWKNQNQMLNKNYKQLEENNLDNLIKIQNQINQFKQLQIFTNQERGNLQQIIKKHQITIREKQTIISKLENQKKYFEKQIILLNINLQQTRQQIVVLSQDYSNKQKRFNQTLQIVKNRNNQLNQKYQKQLKNRDELEERYYKLQQQQNQKINKLTNQLSQVTVMVQRQHVPKGNFAKLQQFQGKITDLQMKLYQKDSQSRNLKIKLQQKQLKIKQLGEFTKSKIKQ